MPLRPALVLAAAALVLAGCSGDGGGPRPTSPSGCTPAGEPGTSVQSMDVDDEQRRYLVQTPEGWTGLEPMPVVYTIHGLGGQADAHLAYTGLAALGEKHGFIVVAPQAEGLDRRWDYRTPASEPGSDASFLRALTDEVADRWCVDEERQFATGMSNGSAVVMALACSGDFPFRAYGAVAAAFYDDDVCEGSPPASIVYFHGKADLVVPFEGGPTPLEPAPPVEESLEGWAEHDGCDETPEVRRSGKDVEHLTWEACDDGARLEAYYVEGGGHTWPGALPIPGMGRTTETVEAAEVMTSFFGLDD